jgi:hypothetical protein
MKNLVCLAVIFGLTGCAAHAQLPSTTVEAFDPLAGDRIYVADGRIVAVRHVTGSPEVAQK